MKLGIIAVLLLVQIVLTLRKPVSFPWSKATSSENLEGSYQELYYTQKVSHFNYKLSTNTWKQRYLIDLSNWSKDTKGPILMYMGNEGPI